MNESPKFDQEHPADDAEEQYEEYLPIAPVAETVERSAERASAILLAVESESDQETLEEALDLLLAEEALVREKANDGTADPEAAAEFRKAIDILMSRMLGGSAEKGIQGIIDRALMEAESLTRSGKAIDAVPLLTAILIGKKYKKFFEKNADAKEALTRKRDEHRAEYQRQWAAKKAEGERKDDNGNS